MSKSGHYENPLLLQAVSSTQAHDNYPTIIEKSGGGLRPSGISIIGDRMWKY